MTDCGGLGTAELREALTVSRGITAALSAFQTNAALIISKTERHGDGGTGVLAETAGLSRRDARGQVKTAETISATPSVRDAVESGRVTEANARRLAEAVERTSAQAVEADGGLLAKAETLRPEDFAKESRRWVADRQDDDGEREYQRLRAKRSLHIWDADDGTVQLHGVFDPVAGKRIGKRLRAEAGRMYDSDKKTAARGGRRASGFGELPDAGRRTFRQCMADALDNHTSRTAAASMAGSRAASAGAGLPAGAGIDTCQPTNTGARTREGTDAFKGRLADSATGTHQGADQSTGSEVGRLRVGLPSSGQGADQLTDAGAGPVTGAGAGRSFADISVNVQVDAATGKLIAELPDGARLPEAVLEELVCNSRLTGFIYGARGTPIWQTKSSRTATEQQRRWLLNRWGGCFHCAADPDMCQIHHIVPVSAGGATKIDNMVPVCWDCHQKIHHHRWQIHKRSDGRHSLHPPKHTHHGPAHAPEQPLLFTQNDQNCDDPDHSEPPPPRAAEAATLVGDQHPSTAPRAQQPLLFTQNDHRLGDPRPASRPEDPNGAPLASNRSPSAGPSGPATARAALAPRRPPYRDPEPASSGDNGSRNGGTTVASALNGGHRSRR